MISGSLAQAGGGPRALAVHPGGGLLYVANFLSNNVYAYTINPMTGALARLPGTFATGFNPSGIAVDPTGTFTYVTNLSNNNVFAYTIEDDGRLTRTPGAFATERSPYAITADAVGPFVYVVNFGSNSVSTYRIDPDSGGLMTIGPPVAAGVGPVAVTTTGPK